MAVAVALTLGALAWTVDQGVGYPLVKVACASGEATLLTTVSVAALMLGLAGFAIGLIAFRVEPTERPRLFAGIATGFNALTVLYIVLTTTFPFLLSPCE
jgi:hypothetical protein